MISRTNGLLSGILIVLAFAKGAAGAQTITTDEGSLFGSSGNSDNTSQGAGSLLDTSDLFDGEVLTSGDSTANNSTVPPRSAVEIGGSYRFLLTGTVGWPSLDDLAGSLLAPDSQGVKLDLGATVFLDARPTEDFRVFGKVGFSYPFTTDEDTESVRTFDDIVSVTELFSDFMLGDAFFLRGGKHEIAWGVGYFFSPADVLNLTAIDPDDPEAEREGPVSLRINLPVNFHNLYLYVLADPIDDGVQLAAAPKAEIVLGGTEIGLGAYYHPDRVPRAMLTLSTSLSQYELFGEMEASLGSDRRFVETTNLSSENPFGLRTMRYPESVFAAATGGLRYRYTPDSKDWSATIIGQYLWNGEGYEDPDFLRENASGIAALIIAGDLSTADLSYPGRHYGAASLSLSIGREADWSLGTFWISNLSDGSGRVSPSLTFQPADQLSLRVAATVTYGADGAEMTPSGGHVAASLIATLGAGRF